MSNFERNIMSVFNDIDSMNVNKYEVFYKSVEERLSKSLSTYDSELSKSLDYLERKDAVKVMRRINST